jgi:hypothetical protein
MEQINEVRYRVTKGEMITVQLVATKVGDTATFTASPADVEQVDSSPRTFQFTVNAAPGKTIFGAVTCDFTAAQDEAQFQAIISSAGSGPFQGPTINKDDPDSEEPISIDFRIVNPNQPLT